MSKGKVFICVPADNTALARDKIVEVFNEGYTPMEMEMVCNFRNIQNTERNRHRVLDECQQLRVYGSEWTDEMWSDIRYALKNNIPVYSDQDMIPGGRPIRLDEEPPQHNNKPKRKKDAHER